MSLFGLLNKSDNFEKSFLSLFECEDLFVPREDAHVKSMGKAFSEYESITRTAFIELTSLVKDSPQSVIDIIRETFTGDVYTTVLGNVIQDANAYIDKMKNISLMWEIAAFHKLQAYLLSGRKTNPDYLDSPSSIYSQFKDFGLRSKDIDLLRKIRNAKNHRFTLAKGYLISNIGESEVRISIADISRLHEKVETISSWCITSMLYSIVHIPRFGVLFAYALIEKLMKIDKSDIKDYVDGLRDFFPDELLNPKKNLTLKLSMHRALRKMKKKLRRKRNEIFYKDDIALFLRNHIVLIIDRLSFHLIAISSTLDEISAKLDNPDDRNNIAEISQWFAEHGAKLSSIPERELMDHLAKKFA